MQEGGRMLSSTGQILEQPVYQASRLHCSSEQNKNILQFLNIKPIQCGTAALEGGRPKEIGVCRFSLRVLPCCGRVWGVVRGKDPGN